jgi:dienelactone hydrolase
MTLAYLVIAASLGAEAPIDWPALIQKPYEKATVPDLKLKPLLVAEDGTKITTKAEWEKARASLRDAWLKELGKPPDKADKLDVKIEKTEKLDGFTRQLLSFQSEGDDRIRAYLLTPVGLKKPDKRPAVVVFHPTTRETLKEPAGLGDNPERAHGVHLVERGYVVLCPECYILKDPEGWAKGQAAALEKRRPGWTGMGKMTFDASRCIDLLESLPEVDKERIGCLGHSLGAKEVLYAMAFEPRYRAGVFNEGGIGIRMSNWTDVWYLTESIKPRLTELEHHQLIALIAPRPFLILGGGDADGDASWPFVKTVLPVYQLLGAGERVGLINHKGKHSFPAEARKLAYRWLDDGLGFTPTPHSGDK